MTYVEAFKTLSEMSKDAFVSYVCRCCLCDVPSKSRQAVNHKRDEKHRNTVVPGTAGLTCRGKDYFFYKRWPCSTYI